MLAPVLRAALAATLAFAPTLALAAAPPTADQPPASLPREIPALVEALVRDETFIDVALSPNGEFFAATVHKEGRTGLVIGRVADVSLVSSMAGGSDSHISGFWWANDTQVVASMGESFGQLEAPRDFGELWLLDAEVGARGRMLAGWRGAQMTTGTRLARNTDHNHFVFMSDPLRHDDEHILVSVESVHAGGEGFATAERLALSSGARQVVARAPVQRASFLADPNGEVRFAWGAGADNRLRTYYRSGQGADWVLVNDEGQSRVRVVPVGFSADGAIAYVESTHIEGTNSIDRLDPATLQRTIVLRHPVVDPDRVLFDPATGAPFGAVFVDGLPHSRFFDPESAPARTQRSLEAAFPGQAVGRPILGTPPTRSLNRSSSSGDRAISTVLPVVPRTLAWATRRMRLPSLMGRLATVQSRMSLSGRCSVR